MQAHAASRPNMVHPTWALAAITAAAILCYAGALPSLGITGPVSATCIAVAAAAFLSGIAGFAFSAICGAILFHFRHDTIEVVQIMLVCSIANQSFSVWTLRHDIRNAVLAPFLAGAAIGVPAGVWLLTHLQASVYARGLGAILFAYGLYMLFRKPIVLARSPRTGDVLSGLVGGLMGGFAATPGAAVSIWCGMKGWDKARQRAVFQPYILVTQLLALALVTLLRQHTGGGPAIPPTAWACVPAGLAGTWWGIAGFRRLSDRQFGAAINLLLIASGAGLAL